MASNNWLLPLGIVAVVGVAVYLARNAATPPAYDQWGNPMETDTPLPLQFTPSALATSQQGRVFIETNEGKAYNAYPDAAGIWTIGVGHKIVPGDGLLPASAFSKDPVTGRIFVSDIKAVKALALSEQQVQDIFSNDLATAETELKSRVTVPLSQGQFDALVDFIFNIGGPKFGKSTMYDLIQARNYDNAAVEFQKWIYAHDAAGNTISPPGLLARRQGETKVFLA
jgi:lysozyme